jgi:hypothetical protein
MDFASLIVFYQTLVTRHPFVHVFQPILVLALETYFAKPTEETLHVLYCVRTPSLSLSVS